jgi:hypothetical protein
MENNSKYGLFPNGVGTGPTERGLSDLSHLSLSAPSLFKDDNKESSLFEGGTGSCLLAALSPNFSSPFASVPSENQAVLYL